MNCRANDGVWVLGLLASYIIGHLMGSVFLSGQLQ
jgi:hypothetical protein